MFKKISWLLVGALVLGLFVSGPILSMALLVALLVMVVINRKIYVTPIFKLGFIPLLSIVLLCFFVGIFSNNSLYDILRDTYYLLNPVLYVLFGFYLAKSEKKDLCQSIIIAGAITSLFIVYNVISNLFENGFNSLYAIRSSIGISNYLLSISLFLFLAKSDLLLKKYNIFLLILMIIGFALSFSRMELLYLGILVFMYTCLSFFYEKDKRKMRLLIKKEVIGCLIMGIFFVGILLALPKETKSFINKIANSFDEINYSNSYDVDRKTLNNNWRGYEVFVAKEHLSEYSNMEFIFGKGFGESVPLSFYIELGSSRMNELPYFHNGFYTFLVKGGIISLLAYFLFLVQLFVFGIKKMKDCKIYNCYIVMLPFVILASTFFVCGVFGAYSTMTVYLILLGVCFQKSEEETLAKKDENQAENDELLEGK